MGLISAYLNDVSLSTEATIIVSVEGRRDLNRELTCCALWLRATCVDTLLVAKGDVLYE